jgi:hypothetical protein
MRLKTAVLTAVLAGSLAGPTVVDASAATHSRSASAKSVSRKASSKAKPADTTPPGPDPVGVVESIISEVEFDVSGSNLQSLLWDLPGFGPY